MQLQLSAHETRVLGHVTRIAKREGLAFMRQGLGRNADVHFSGPPRIACIIPLLELKCTLIVS